MHLFLNIYRFLALRLPSHEPLKSQDALRWLRKTKRCHNIQRNFNIGCTSETLQFKTMYIYIYICILDTYVCCVNVSVILTCQIHLLFTNIYMHRSLMRLGSSQTLIGFWVFLFSWFYHSRTAISISRCDMQIVVRRLNLFRLGSFTSACGICTTVEFQAAAFIIMCMMAVCGRRTRDLSRDSRYQGNCCLWQAWRNTHCSCPL